MIHPGEALAGVSMRVRTRQRGSLFRHVDLEERIPARHPLQKVREVVNDALGSLDAAFEALCADFGRPSIPRERLLRASLIQILFSTRSERLLTEQMQPTSCSGGSPALGSKTRSGPRLCSPGTGNGF